MKLLVVLVVFVVLLAALFVGADIGSRVYLEHQLAGQVDGYEPGAGATVAIHAFPWLPDLARRGRVEEITAHAARVSQGSFVVSDVEITVTRVRIDRHLLLHKHLLEVTAIDTGTVTAIMSQADLDRWLGVPVTLGAGTASVTVAGVTVSASVSVRNGQLQLDAAGLPVSVPIPTLPLLPCLAQATVVPGHLDASCTFHTIPAALRSALESPVG